MSEGKKKPFISCLMSSSFRYLMQFLNDPSLPLPFFLYLLMLFLVSDFGIGGGIFVKPRMCSPFSYKATSHLFVVVVAVIDVAAVHYTHSQPRRSLLPTKWTLKSVLVDHHRRRRHSFFSFSNRNCTSSAPSPLPP